MNHMSAFNQGRTSSHGSEIIASGLRPVLLLVDDCPLVQQVALATLRRYADRIDIAGDGEEALFMHGGGHYDVIFMDLDMPGIGGLETMKRIRDRERETVRPRTPIVIISGSIVCDIQSSCLRDGADCFLTKPFNPTLVLNTLHSLLPGIRL